MQPSARTVAAIAGVTFVMACDGKPLSPRIRPAADEASLARPVSSSALTTRAVTASEIDLAWPDNSPNEMGWEVHRSTTGSAGAFTLLATLGAGSTFYANTDLTQLTEYCYKVRAFRKAGPNINYSAFLNTSCSTTLAGPPAPSDVSATPVGGGTVKVTWTDNSSTENGFWIQRSASPSGPFDKVLTAPANTTSTFNGSPVEQQICFRVLAFNDNGTSDPSNVDCTTPPMGPSGLTARSVDSHSIDLAWTDNSGVEDGYEVLRLDANLVFVAIARTPANASSYHDASVTTDVRYTYTVRALKDGGFSLNSNNATAMSVSGPPTAPTNLDAAPSGSTSVSVYWQSTSNIAESNRVERSLDGGATWTAFVLSDPTWNGYSDIGLPTEQRVCYRAFAVNRAGDSPASNTDCTTPPAAATNFSASYGDGVDLQWKDNSAVEDAYAVLALYDDGSGFIWEYLVATLPPNTESYHLDDPYVYPPGSWFTVVAVKDNGYSDWASEAPFGALLTNALRAPTAKDPRIALRSSRLAKPFDVRLSALRKLRPSPTAR